MAKYIGVPGNTMQEQMDFTNELAREARVLREIGEWIKEQSGHDFYVDALRFGIKDDEGYDVLLVVTATTNDGYVVSFFSGTSMLDCMKNLTRQIKTDRVKWKADEYRNK